MDETIKELLEKLAELTKKIIELEEIIEGEKTNEIF